MEGRVGRADDLLDELPEPRVGGGVLRDLAGLDGVDDQALEAAGTPSWFICVTRLACSCEYTSEPSTATPVTAPISRLVLLADAAMPERSAGTADSTEEVIGTTVVPMPMPASASASVSGP